MAGTLGEQELALLRWIADSKGATVGQVLEGFGAKRQLARSTILTMMERMRKKGHLSRRVVGGVHHYRARRSSAAVLRDAVGRFVRTHLGGSSAPLVAYLLDAPDLSDAERVELRDVVARLQ